MKFWEAMKAVQEGKTVRFTQWAQGLTLNRDDWMVGQFDEREFDSDDWEIYEEPKPTFSFMEVVKGLKQGKKFKRPQWGKGVSFGLISKDRPDVRVTFFGCGNSPLILDDFEATDWEEVE